MKLGHCLFVFSFASMACSIPAMAHMTPAEQSQTTTADPSADQGTEPGATPRANVVQRGPDGHATMVRENGHDYPVCTRAGQDACIEPRAAGLNWGNRPLKDWPGQPASQIDGDQGHIAQ